MEGLFFQWDKACDAMPILKPAVKFLFVSIFLFLILIFLPSIFLPENDFRPKPNKNLVYDTVKKTYVKWGSTEDPLDSFHPIKTKEIKKIVKTRPVIETSVEDGVVYADLPPGIGKAASDLLDQDVWNYTVEVAYIVDSAYGRKRLHIDTGVFVDTRDLHEVSSHMQKVTLDPPTPNRSGVENYNVVVKTMRSVVTHCTYYSMNIFGAERLVLGGNGSKIESTC